MKSEEIFGEFSGEKFRMESNVKKYSLETNLIRKEFNLKKYSAEKFLSNGIQSAEMTKETLWRPNFI
jgi:hypothetical protein